MALLSLIKNADQAIEENYEIKFNGSVWGKKQNKPLKGHITNSGYRAVTMSINNTRIQKTVHRMIAKKFIPNPNNFPVVHHKNHNKLDNRIENLEWITHSENGKAHWARGTRQTKAQLNHTKTLGQISAKQSRQIPMKYARAIREEYTTGVIKQRELAVIYGISKGLVSAIVTNKKYKEVS